MPRSERLDAVMLRLAPLNAGKEGGRKKSNNTTLSASMRGKSCPARPRQNASAERLPKQRQRPKRKCGLTKFYINTGRNILWLRQQTLKNTVSSWRILHPSVSVEATGSELSPWAAPRSMIGWRCGSHLFMPSLTGSTRAPSETT